MPIHISKRCFVAALLAVGLLHASRASGDEPTFAEIVAAAKQIEAVGGRVNVAWEPSPPNIRINPYSRRQYVLSQDLKAGEVVDLIRFRNGPDQPEGLFGDQSKPEDWPAKRSVRDSDLKVLPAFPKLEFLTLSECQISDVGLAEVKILWPGAW